MNSDYDGKIITIVEDENENPLITTTDSAGNPTHYYNQANPDDNYLFNESLAYTPTTGGVLPKLIKHESVDFIWVNDINMWVPMR